MSKTWIFFLILVSINISLDAQYVSDISIPAKGTAKITDKNIATVRYAESIDPATMRKHLSILASDSLEGRETGQKGLKMAGDYITKILGNIGIETVDGQSSYLLPIAFTFSSWAKNELSINGEKYRHLWDYLAFQDKNAEMASLMEKEVLFLGYGIDDPAFSDYKKVNVKDKVILINRGEPMINDSISLLTKSTQRSDWSDADMSKKLKIAKEKGVKLVLIIENDIKKQLEDNRRKLLGAFAELGNKKDVEQPFANHVFISSTIAKVIIGNNEDKIIKARKNIAKGKPANVKLAAEVTVTLLKEVKVLEGNNIMGMIKGKTKPDEYVIVSAHYDHIGMRGDEVFNGANDNGSGSTTLLELAKVCQQAVFEGNRPDRSILFLWFCGEEKGLLGSQYYSENPAVPLANTMVNINIDMVGRRDEKYSTGEDFIYVIGSDRLSSD
ncbi:MAG: M28 family peptidase, partial [Saprospiraceae bacterium]